VALTPDAARSVRLADTITTVNEHPHHCAFGRLVACVSETPTWICSEISKFSANFQHATRCWWIPRTIQANFEGKFNSEEAACIPKLETLTAHEMTAGIGRQHRARMFSYLDHTLQSATCTPVVTPQILKYSSSAAEQHKQWGHQTWWTCQTKKWNRHLNTQLPVSKM
jgi:hypothetical protein